MTTLRTLDEVENAILARFKTAWDTTGYDWTIENDELQTDDEPWARVTLNAVTSRVRGYGAGIRRRREGTIIVQIFTRPNKGVQKANQLAQVVIDAFESDAYSGQIKFSDVVPQKVGVQRKWYQLNVSVIYRWDSVE